MDTIVGILSSLGVDNTFFIQLLLFMVVFVFVWNVAFSPYFKAFQKREAQTTGSEQLALELIKDTEKLELEYQQKARALNDQIKDVFDAEKKVAVKEQEAIVNVARETAKNFVGEAREKIQAEYNRAHKELFAQTKTLGTEIAAQLTRQERS